MFPEFIGIGAQKAGTTWLHRNLAAHPEVWMPREKEVHYFDRKMPDRSSVLVRLLRRRRIDDQWRRQVKHRLVTHGLKERSLQKLRWDYKYYLKPYNDAWYASIFDGHEGAVTGEITPAYSVLGRDTISHVHKIMPDAKILFMMRNPIERVWSQAVMSFDKAEKGSALARSEEETLLRLKRHSSGYLTGYGRTLENWGAFYAPDEIFVGFLEDIHFHPEALLRSVYDFLGVDPTFEPEKANKKVHSRSAPTMPVKFAVHLARMLRDETAWLGERFGGYPAFWNHTAERLLQAPPTEDEIPYPLYESPLWDAWEGSRSVGLQSGVLSSMKVAV